MKQAHILEYVHKIEYFCKRKKDQKDGAYKNKPRDKFGNKES